MNRDIQLAYLGIEVPEPSSLDAFFGDVIGLVRADTHAWRNDAKAHRVIIERGSANDVAFVGFEATDDEAFDRALARLNAAGFDTADGDADDLRARKVARLVRSEERRVG